MCRFLYVEWGHNVSSRLDIIAAGSILMNRRRSLELFSCAALILCLVAVIAGAQTQPAQVRATDKPFLWRIDGPVPSYLYGTVHVPDPRVLELPEVEDRARAQSHRDSWGRVRRCATKKEIGRAHD